ncbi:gastrula zinc finger protein XlCGF17.1-like [Bufo gargarizans]|uniref:gastrula zinc finger protein XlCGF17.1-like n=1 Tax=Bufo gargarizans TaxID=30331 RepID=UPI001CF22401|nr:gastrula zinc finger protein XlCGF17.1-like [Bufo gargarizans]
MMEEHQPLISQAENSHKNSEGNVMLSLNYKAEDEDIMQCSSGENLNVHPGLHSTDLSYNPSDHEESSSDQSQIATTSAGQKGGERFQVITKRSSLSTDRRIRTREKTFSCPQCGKYFAYKSALVRHERSHTGEKPYSCSECGKYFAHKAHLARHERSHTGEKPNSCSECGKYFACKSHLVRHEKSHTGDKPYSCSEFRKPYSCSECEQCFNQKSDRDSHEKSHRRVRIRSQFQNLDFDFDSN